MSTKIKTKAYHRYGKTITTSAGAISFDNSGVAEIDFDEAKLNALLSRHPDMYLADSEIKDATSAPIQEIIDEADGIAEKEDARGVVIEVFEAAPVKLDGQAEDGKGEKKVTREDLEELGLADLREMAIKLANELFPVRVDEISKMRAKNGLINVILGTE